MAPEVNKVGVNQPTELRRRPWRHFVVVLVLVAACALGGYLKIRADRTAAVRSALPAAPAVTPNSTVRELIDQARMKAAHTADAPEVAELGRLLHANGYNEEAENCWRILIRLQPDDPRWHRYLADLHRAAGDYEAAEAAWQAAVRADPSAAVPWLHLAELKFKSGRLAEAEADYRRRLALLPDDPYSELGLARLAQHQGRTEETLGRLERVLKNHPKFSAAHNLYAELQAAAGREELADHHRWLGREAGRFREADDPWMDQLNARCHEPRRLCHLGTIAYQTGRGDLGRAQFEKAIAVAPDEPLAYQLLGELMLEQESPEAAHDFLSRGISLAKTTRPTPRHYLKLSEAHQALERMTEARRALEDGLGLYPGAAELHAGLGYLLKAEGRDNEAIAAHHRALALNPALAESDFALALALMERGRRDEAVQRLHHALESQPTFPKALLLLGRLEMDAGRIEDAGRYLLPLLKANPGAPEVREILATWRLRAGRAIEQRDPATAEKHYRAGLLLRPEHPELNASLGVRLLITNRVAAAVPLLESYQRAQPENPEAALFLGQAYARTGRIPDARRILTEGLRRAELSGQTTTAGHFREILSVLR